MDYLQYPEYNKVIEILKDGFKPYYKWITFNTYYAYSERVSVEVLNLIINGLPSIHKSKKIIGFSINERVLNLIINGLPSIPK